MNNNLNIEQQSLITMYMNQYNITNNHIEQFGAYEISHKKFLTILEDAMDQ